MAFCFDINGELRCFRWNDITEPVFCEARYWDNAVPHINEFTNGLTGFPILFLGVAGFYYHPRLDLVGRSMFGAMAVAGVGTVLMHWFRIYAFHFADVFPMLFCLTLAWLAFLDQIISEINRWSVDPLNSQNENLEDPQRMDTTSRIGQLRNWLHLLAHLAVGCFFIVGLVAMAMVSPTVAFFSYYFGVGYGVLMFIAAAYMYNRYRKFPVVDMTFRVLLLSVVGMSIVALFFKLSDYFLCGPVWVWFLPHSFWHVFMGMANYYAIICLCFYRMNCDIHSRLPKSELLTLAWRLKIIPVLIFPESEYASRNSAVMSTGSAFSMEQVSPVSPPAVEP